MVKLICDKCHNEYNLNDTAADDKNESIVYSQKKYTVRIIQKKLTVRNDDFDYQYDRDLDLCPKCRSDITDIITKFIGISDGVSK